MKSPTKLLVSLTAACLLLGACQSSTTNRGNPRSASHWNSGFAAESASLHAFGANSYTPDTIRQTGQSASESMVTTFRRHFFNDNPDNPLQEHRYGPYDRYIPIIDGPKYAVLDVWDMTRSGGRNAWQGLVAALWMPVQVFGGSSVYSAEDNQPPGPDEFEVVGD